MKLRKRLFTSVAAVVLAAATMLSVTACGSGNRSDAAGERVGGFLNYGLVNAAPFSGVMNPVFSMMAADAYINDFIFRSLVALRPDNTSGDRGAAWFEYNHLSSPATITVHFHDDVQMYWHDGTPLTMYDVEFTYLKTAHPEVITDRFGPALGTSTVIGIDEYRENPAVGISGIRVFNDGRSIEFQYESIDPSMLFAGFWTMPTPRHIWENVPFAEMSDHPNNNHPIGNGPFKFYSTVPGESVILHAFEDYWLGAPLLDGIHIAWVTPANIGEEMLIGNFDIASFPVSFLPDYEPQFGNAVVLHRAPERLFTFLGFRFGTRDNAEGVITLDPDTIINCVYLRRAIGYSRDDAGASLYVFAGNRTPIGQTFIPWQGDFFIQDFVGFTVFDLDKASAILDEAGYTWVEGEDFRRHNVTGEPFELVWAIVTNPDNDILVDFHIENWARVGLNVVLYQNRMLATVPERSDILGQDLDNGVIHMYDAGWNFGANPNPRGMWGNTTHNATRYTSARIEELFALIEDSRAWDPAWLLQQTTAFAEYVYEQAPWIPGMTGDMFWVTNRRVGNFSLVRHDGYRQVGSGAPHLWYLTSERPYSAR